MKKTEQIILLSTIFLGLKSMATISTSAAGTTAPVSAAGLSTAKTGLWQVPSPSALRLKLESLDLKLAKVCSDYRELVVSDPGKTEFDPEDIARMREETPNVYEKIFTARFRINIATIGESTQRMVNDANQNIAALQAVDPIPLFTLRLGDIAPQLIPSSDIIAFWQRDSMLAISKSVGLKPLPISLVATNGGWNLVVKGKDSACDLLEGQGWVEFDSKMQVVPNAVDLKVAKDYYSQVSEVVNQALGRKKTALGRSAYFGFKMTDVFKANNISGDRLAEGVANLVDLLFDDSMQLKAESKDSQGKSQINVADSVTANLRIQMGR